MKIITSLVLLTLFVGCASQPTVFPEEKGVTCYQTEEQANEKKHTCLRIDSFSDSVKWHRVRSWQTLPEIPDLP